MRIRYPGGFVTIRSGPSTFRSCETKFWSDVAAVRGGCSPQSASINRSVETARPASSRSSARRARCFGPPSSRGRVFAGHLERAEQAEVLKVSYGGSPCLLQEDRARVASVSTARRRAVSEPLAARDRAVWTPADGGRMATNTHIPVRSARRCILRSAVTKFIFATAVAIATSSALALSGALTAGPGIAQATGPSCRSGRLGPGLRLSRQAVRPRASHPRELRRPAHAVSRAADDEHAHARGRQLLVPPGRRHLRFRRHRRLPGRRRDRHVRLVGVDPRDVGRRPRLRVLAHPPARPERPARHRSADPSRPRHEDLQSRAPDRVRRRPRGQSARARPAHSLSRLDASGRSRNHLPPDGRRGRRAADLRARPRRDRRGRRGRLDGSRFPQVVRPGDAGADHLADPQSPHRPGRRARARRESTSATGCRRTRLSGRSTRAARTRTRWSGGITTRTKSAARTSSSSRSSSTPARFATASTT